MWIVAIGSVDPNFARWVRNRLRLSSRGDMCFFFFFQAEDGIRDLTVTGVQTCALPICQMRRRRQHGCTAVADVVETQTQYLQPAQIRRLGDHLRAGWAEVAAGEVQLRSEERRVGKEGRSRWSPYH